MHVHMSIYSSVVHLCTQVLWVENKSTSTLESTMTCLCRPLTAVTVSSQLVVFRRQRCCQFVSGSLSCGPSNCLIPALTLLILCLLPVCDGMSFGCQAEL